MPSIPGLTGPGEGGGPFPWSGGGAFPSSGGGVFPWSGAGGWGVDQGQPVTATPVGGAGSTGGSQNPMIAELRALRAEVRNLTGVAGAIPRATGQHVGAAVNGAAAAGSFRNRYP